jgi:hypothetical protein
MTVLEFLIEPRGIPPVALIAGFFLLFALTRRLRYTRIRAGLVEAEQLFIVDAANQARCHLGILKESVGLRLVDTKGLDRCLLAYSDRDDTSGFMLLGRSILPEIDEHASRPSAALRVKGDDPPDLEFRGGDGSPQLALRLSGGDGPEVSLTGC